MMRIEEARRLWKTAVIEDRRFCAWMTRVSRGGRWEYDAGIGGFVYARGALSPEQCWQLASLHYDAKEVQA